MAGLLKKAIRIRPELKVIITSATLDIKKFADYFGAPMVRIPGKMFPVSVEYAPVDGASLTSRANKTDSYLVFNDGNMKLISLWPIKLNRPPMIASLTLSHIE